MDSEVPMLRVMMHGGLLSADDFTKRRNAWYSRAQATENGRPLVHLWALAYADYIESPAEASAALEALPAEATGAIHIEKETFSRAELGHTLLLAGNAEAALPHLDGATLACNWLHWPVQHTRALLHLGQAHEALGQTESACEAYQRVVARWNTAEKSATRDTAKARLQALACGTEARRVTVASVSDADAARSDTKTVTRTAVGRSPRRGLACAEAKRAAIARTMCSKPKSVGGDCECSQRSDEWVCAATMAVTCD